mmetsp:Transcript_28020/g.77080  ORF Transcript_28020/g.77080 Transcript_28020/m.77080 type:complete len:276 (-) Transcript_28020:572-1399(-)
MRHFFSHCCSSNVIGRPPPPRLCQLPLPFLRHPLLHCPNARENDPTLLVAGTPIMGAIMDAAMSATIAIRAARRTVPAMLARNPAPRSSPFPRSTFLGPNAATQLARHGNATRHFPPFFTLALKSQTLSLQDYLRNTLDLSVKLMFRMPSRHLSSLHPNSVVLCLRPAAFQLFGILVQPFPSPWTNLTSLAKLNMSAMTLPFSLTASLLQLLPPFMDVVGLFGQSWTALAWSSNSNSQPCIFHLPRSHLPRSVSSAPPIFSRNIKVKLLLKHHTE